MSHPAIGLRSILYTVLDDGQPTEHRRYAPYAGADERPDAIELARKTLSVEHVEDCISWVDPHGVQVVGTDDDLAGLGAALLDGHDLASAYAGMLADRRCLVQPLRPLPSWPTLPEGVRPVAPGVAIDYSEYGGGEVYYTYQCLFLEPDGTIAAGRLRAWGHGPRDAKERATDESGHDPALIHSTRRFVPMPTTREERVGAWKIPQGDSVGARVARGNWS